MRASSPPTVDPSYSCHVFDAADFEVTSGANLGDPLMPMDDLCLGDVYELHPRAEALHLAVRDAAADGGSGQVLQQGAQTQIVAEGSEVGRLGSEIRMQGRLTVMRPDGDTVAILLIWIRPAEGGEGALYFLPLSPIEPRETYTLVDAQTDPGDVRLADITSVAFTRGTMITLGDGRQCPVEDLHPGDLVLTRNHGPQPLRWIGRRTVRAIGPYAPVVITKGTLSNESDLIVSQHQRLFVYQRGPDRLTDTAELLAKAVHLVDDETIFVRAGGFVEYFHLVLDRHEIIYAECIPTESLLINEATLGQMPAELLQEVSAQLPAVSHAPHVGTEADGRVLQDLGAAALRRAANGS